MPAVQVAEDVFYKISSVLRVSNPSIAFTNPAFLNAHVGAVNNHAWLVLHTKTNTIKGCVTWLTDGFSFELSYVRDTGNRLVPILFLTGHVAGSPNQATYNALALAFLDTCVGKCDLIIASPSEPYIPGALNGLYVKRKVFGPLGKKSKFQQNLDHALSNNLISIKASKFLIKHKKFVSVTMYPKLP